MRICILIDMESFITEEAERSITNGISSMLEQLISTPAQRCYALVRASARMAVTYGIPRDLLLDAIANEYEITKLEESLNTQ